MLVTFSSKVHHDVVMFGDVALALLRAMGFGDRVPGIMRAEDIPRARAALEGYLARLAEPPAGTEDEEEAGEEERPPVSLRNRALPLLDMLAAAEREEADIQWE